MAVCWWLFALCWRQRQRLQSLFWRKPLICSLSENNCSSTRNAIAVKMVELRTGECWGCAYTLLEAPTLLLSMLRHVSGLGLGCTLHSKAGLRRKSTWQGKYQHSPNPPDKCCNENKRNPGTLKWCCIKKMPYFLWRRQSICKPSMTALTSTFGICHWLITAQSASGEPAVKSIQLVLSCMHWLENSCQIFSR